MPEGGKISAVSTDQRDAQEARKKYLNFCVNLVSEERADRLERERERRGHASQAETLRALIDEAAAK